MKPLQSLVTFAAMIVLAGTCAPSKAADQSRWKHSGSLFILTTPEGADLPATAKLKNFPLLVRLHQDFFDFSQAKPDGSDLRFFTPAGDALPYEIEQWDSKAGIASVWVCVPVIVGNARQEVVVRWGNPSATAETSGAAVFNAAYGYLSTWHMSGPVADVVGTLETKDVGTSACPGIIGDARHFPGNQGIFGGEKIKNYPTGAASHTTQAWFRAEKPNTTIIGWGNEGGGRGSKVRMQLRSPPHLHIDSNFSDVNGLLNLSLGEWIHVVHTYDKGDGKIYINGQLDAAATPLLNIKSPERLWIGGWYHNYDFVGDIDEVRISNVARSADWIKLEYENQKPLQTAVGWIVPSGSDLSVSATGKLTLPEGRFMTVDATAGGAQKIYWVVKRDGKEQVAAIDRTHFRFEAGRVSAPQNVTLQLRAIYPNEVRTREIEFSILKAIPDPAFTLKAQPTWDGRTTIEVSADLSNLPQMQAVGAGAVYYKWSTADIAVSRQVAPGKLILTRAQNSGTLTVTATLDNGGTPITQSVDILVTEPATDAWVHRVPAKDETPLENQFYARDDKNEGTLYYNGTLSEAATSVFLRVTADGQPYKQESLKPAADKSYAFTVKLKPGLIHYKVEFGSATDGRETVLNTVNNIACGDAYLINGQSNAEAVAWGKEEYAFSSEWIRSFGSPDGSPQGARQKLWTIAIARGPGGKGQIGYWGMELGRRLVESQKVPICIINGAVGGTRIDQHQRSAADPEDVTTIYGRLLWRVRAAGLADGIRGVIWHQGENDQGADGPTGGFGWETYRAFFLDMAAGWKLDFPNIRHYYVFQIWPKSCAMGINGSDNKLREVQRLLPSAFAHMSVMSTLGIDPPGGCHYPPEGYAEFARLLCPPIERDNYGRQFENAVTAPNLRRATFANDKHDEINLDFDQPVKWDSSLASQFYLDGGSGNVVAGNVTANRLTLKLATPTSATRITYLDSKAWSQKTLLRGVNGIAALTFCDVLISSPQ